MKTVSDCVVVIVVVVVAAAPAIQYLSPSVEWKYELAISFHFCFRQPWRTSCLHLPLPSPYDTFTTPIYRLQSFLICFVFFFFGLFVFWLLTRVFLRFRCGSDRRAVRPVIYTNISHLLSISLFSVFRACTCYYFTWVIHYWKVYSRHRQLILTLYPYKVYISLSSLLTPLC